MLIKNIKLTLGLLLLVGLIFRILLIPVARHGDINNNTSWGEALLDRGTQNFYENKTWKYSAPNQPPLYLYTFGVTTLLNRAFSDTVITLNRLVPIFPSTVVWWNEQWSELYFAKFPGILADLGIAVVIFLFFEKKRKIALTLTALWLFNPVSWYNSAIWGGTDSIVNLLGLLSVYFLLKRKNLTLAIYFFTLSILFKGSLALFAPLLIFLAIKQGHSLKEWVRGAIHSTIATIVISLPFHLSPDVLIWLFNLYTTRFFPGEIGSLTANAFNFWWLVDSGTTLDSTRFFGFSSRIWGILITAGLYSIVVMKLWKKRKTSEVIFGLSLIPFIAFLFMTRIHERYLYPMFPLLTISLGYVSQLWVPYVILSFIHILNLYHLFWAPGINTVKAWYLNPMFMIILSFINLAVFLVVFTRYIRMSSENGEK